METYRIVSVVGTRPEAIKLAPVVRAAMVREGIEHRLVATGQHGALCDDALACFGLRADIDLALGAIGDALVPALHTALQPLFGRLRPDLLIVQGDTTSAWAAAMVGHAQGIAVAHVEAGLRSGDPDLPFPEERNRTAIDRIATLLFAPTEQAAANLRAERVPGDIHLTGNTGIDALLHIAAAAPPSMREDGVRRLLVTCHRRETRGAPLARICDALRRLARRPDIRITVPLHPNPAAGQAMRAHLAGATGIALVAPLAYPAMVAALNAADLVLSDSGGLQEECPALGVPLLILRPNSERPETIACGNGRLIGTDPDRIVAETIRLLDDPAAYAAMARPAFPFGDGRAAQLILGHIEALARVTA